MLFLPNKNRLFQKRVALKRFTKLTRKREVGFAKCWQLLTKGGGGVGEMLTMADKEGRGGLNLPFWADIICDQPFILNQTLLTYLPYLWCRFVYHKQNGLSLTLNLHDFVTFKKNLCLRYSSRYRVTQQCCGGRESVGEKDRRGGRGGGTGRKPGSRRTGPGS